MNATEHEKVSKARADLDAAEDYINSLDLAPNLVHRLRSGIAALDELLAQPVEPEGWKLVPKEPTADMRNAYHAVTDDDVTMKGAAGSRWAAMLAASPQPPEQGDAAMNRSSQTPTDDLPALPEPVGFRMRYRSEPGMVGHYPWTYADHRRRQADRPEHEREDLFNTAQLKAAILADRQARAAQADQCAEVAAALEIRAILEQIKEVAALHPADDMPTPFQSAWQLCCEEIFYRATGQQWHMDEDDGRRNVSGETAVHPSCSERRQALRGKARGWAAAGSNRLLPEAG